MPLFQEIWPPAYQEALLVTKASSIPYLSRKRLPSSLLKTLWLGLPISHLVQALYARLPVYLPESYAYASMIFLS